VAERPSDQDKDGHNNRPGVAAMQSQPSPPTKGDHMTTLIFFLNNKLDPISTKVKTPFFFQNIPTRRCGKYYKKVFYVLKSAVCI
jgi:hypothetical protein